jgi:hypothetical protein
MGIDCNDCKHDCFNHLGVKKNMTGQRVKAKCFVLNCKCKEYIPIPKTEDKKVAAVSVVSKH